MSSSNSDKPLHIAMYPWLALSHLTSFLRLANRLAERGQRISYFVPNRTQAKLIPQNQHPHLITFIPITVPSVEGLPDGAETTNDVPRSGRPAIATAMDLTRPVIEAHLARLKPDFVFFDFAHWLPSVARKHGAKSLYYATSSVVRIAYFISRSDGELTADELMRPPSGFPRPELRLRAHEARALAQVTGIDFGEGITLWERLSITQRECDALASKTCREMEGPYIDYLEKHMGKPVLLAGPLVPDAPDSRLDEQLDGWLKGFVEGSVVYCALGSECTLKKQHFQELLLGLELAGRPFLAFLRTPIECETIELAMPDRFLDRIKGRGIVTNGWVQQPLILKHPSIGCFVTHCGAGSISEAIFSECQIVLLPQALDQFINARFLAMELKVGVEVHMEEDDEFCTKEAFFDAISTMMDTQSEVGRVVRASHAKWRELLCKRGLEESYISRFIEGL